MYKKELLQLIKEQGKGVISTKRDYKLVLKNEKEKSKDYQYSLVYSIVYDGENSIKFTYTNVPQEYPDHDYLKKYVMFNYLTITLDEINNLTFID